MNDVSDGWTQVAIGRHRVSVREYENGVDGEKRRRTEVCVESWRRQYEYSRLEVSCVGTSTQSLEGLLDLTCTRKCCTRQHPYGALLPFSRVRIISLNFYAEVSELLQGSVTLGFLRGVRLRLDEVREGSNGLQGNILGIFGNLGICSRWAV